MKKSSFTLTILASIFAVLGVVLLGITPLIAGGASWMTPTTFGEVATAFVDIFFSTGASYMAAWNLVMEGNLYAILGLVAAGVFVLSWLIHFIITLARRRYRSLFPNLLWLIFGAVLTGFCCACLVPDFLPLTSAAEALSANHNVINIIHWLYIGDNAYVNAGGNVALNWVYAIIMSLPFVFFALGYLLGFIGVIVAMADCIAHPGVKKAKNDKARAKALTDARLPVDDNDALKAAMYDELDPSAKPAAAPAPVAVESTSADTPIIVQHIYYNGQPAQTITTTPEPKKEEEEKKSEPAPAPEPVKEQQKEIHIHIYNPAPEAKKEEEEKKSEPAPAPLPAPEVKPLPVVEEENRPLTARELRAIIKEALDDHDHPDNDKPLTDEEARALVRAELDEYYAKTNPSMEEKEEADEVELTPISLDEFKDDIRAAIHDGIHEYFELNETKEEEPAPQEEEKAEETPAEKETLSKDDIKSILDEELAALRKELDEREAARKAEEEAKAKEEAEAKAKAEEEAALAQKEKEEKEAALKAEEEEKARLAKEEAEKKEEEERAKRQEEERRRAAEAEEAARAREQALAIQKEVDNAQNEAIASIKDNLLKADDIRAIIAEELAKLPKPEPVVIKEVVTEPVVEEAPAPEPEPEPEPEPAPATEEKPATEEVAPAPVEAAKPKIIRIPFPTRLLDADEEMKANYNELKAECLSYGLKSRLSNSGDTFRLHTKTYVKITVAGKSLKLYLALDPKDYENSTIPVKDAGGKNIYREIPVVFKVKSPLSMKRAKQLIADACEHDDLEQGKIIEKDYVSELVDYRPQNSSDATEEADDEE